MPMSRYLTLLLADNHANRYDSLGPVCPNVQFRPWLGPDSGQPRFTRQHAETLLHILNTLWGSAL